MPPLFNDVVDVEVADAGNTGGGAGREQFASRAWRNFVFGGDGDAQGGVTNDEGGIGVGEHGGGVRIGFEKFWGDLPAAGGEDFDERLGAAGAAVERDAAGLADGDFADVQEAAHALLGGDGEVGQDGETNALAHDALVFDRGNDGDVGGAGAQGFGTLRGDAEEEVVFALEGSVSETADERDGVEILHDGDAEFGHGRLREVSG